MNTAKNLLLLDDNNNNISPITNIESLYYEVNEGGIIYRNSLYLHFPIYVKYNNNIDSPISLKSLMVTDNLLSQSFPTNGMPELLKKANIYLLEGTSDILVSSIRLTRLANTRYHKLDISTYNLTDILNLYSSKEFVVDNVSTLLYKTDNIVYNTEILEVKNSGSIAQVKSVKDLGVINKGTDIQHFSGKTLNSLIDEAFFPEQYPTLTGAYIKLKDYIHNGIIGMNISFDLVMAMYKYKSNTNIITTNDKAKDDYNDIIDFIYNIMLNAVDISTGSIKTVYQRIGQDINIPTGNILKITLSSISKEHLLDIIWSTLFDGYAEINEGLDFTVSTDSVALNYPLLKTDRSNNLQDKELYNMILHATLSIQSFKHKENPSNVLDFNILDTSIYTGLGALGSQSSTSYRLYMPISYVFPCLIVKIKLLNNTNLNTNISNTIDKSVLTLYLQNSHDSYSLYKVYDNKVGDYDQYIEFTYALLQKILLIIPSMHDASDEQVLDAIKIISIKDHECELPITDNNSQYKWSSITTVIDNNNDTGIRVLTLDPIIAGNITFKIRINTKVLL